MAEKKKKVLSMEEEDRAFFENAMKNPEIKKKIEEDMKKRANLPDEIAKRKAKQKK